MLQPLGSTKQVLWTLGTRKWQPRGESLCSVARYIDEVEIFNPGLPKAKAVALSRTALAESRRAKHIAV